MGEPPMEEESSSDDQMDVDLSTNIVHAGSPVPAAIPQQGLVTDTQLSTPETTSQSQTDSRPQKFQDTNPQNTLDFVQHEDQHMSGMDVIDDRAPHTPPPSTLVNTFEIEDAQARPESPSLFLSDDEDEDSHKTALPVSKTPALCTPDDTPVILHTSTFGGPDGRFAAMPSIFGGPTQAPKPVLLLRDDRFAFKLVKPSVDSSAEEEEEEEDVMLIEEADASDEARQKWKVDGKKIARRDDDVNFIKSEFIEHAAVSSSVPVVHMPYLSSRKPADGAAIVKLIAAQRFLLSGNAQNNGEGSSRDPSRADRHPNPQFEEFGNYTFGRVNDQLLEDDEVPGENSWMVREDEAVDGSEKMILLRESLEEKKRRGDITSDETFELLRIRNILETRERVRAAASRRDEDGKKRTPLPAESREETIRRHRHDHLLRLGSEGAETDFENDADGAFEDDNGASHLWGDFDFLDAEEDLDSTKSGKPRKRRGPVRAKNAREYNALEDEKGRKKERAKAQKKKGRQPTAEILPSSSRRKTAPAAAKGRGKGKAEEKEKASRKIAKKDKSRGKDRADNDEDMINSRGSFTQQNGEDQIGRLLLDNLLKNDPVLERLQNPVFDRPAEPTISGPQVKNTQFQLLFSNIPEPEDQTQKGAIRTDKAKLKKASRSFGYAKCKAVDGKWLIKGMISSLYHHQLLGAQWMIQRELSSQPPHGGLLADSMGLGKTIQTLACMVGHPPSVDDINREVKATLIVAPASIIGQWMDETRTHVKQEVFPKIMQYKSSSRIDMSILQDVDIVFVSYYEVMKQFPFPDKAGRSFIAEHGYDKWWEDAIENMGPLHQINWYRVVLDEAQAIKNNGVRTSLACQNLKSVFRWCLTGTPLLNRLEELFPYLRFLKANYSIDWQTFQKYFCDPHNLTNYARIETLLSYTMMRRTMATTILNRPIVTLPTPHPSIQYVNFSAEERIIYRITENRFRRNLNVYFEKGLANRNYGVFMVQLLRLRQCTSHPFMLERTIKESWTMEDVNSLRVQLKALKKKPKPFYEQCQLWVEESEARRNTLRQQCQDIPNDEMLPFGRSTYGLEFHMDKVLDSLDEVELFERVSCSICGDVPLTPMQTDCGHIYCNDCIQTYCHELVAQGQEFMTCVQCSSVFHNINPVRAPAISDEVENGNISGSSFRSGPRGKDKGKKRDTSISKGRDLRGFEPMTKDSSWIELSDIDEDFPLTPSSKTTALKSLLLKGFEEAPLDKVVVYVQFRTLARIVGRICNAEGWGFVYLTGDCSIENRTKIIKHFRDSDDCKILVAGLKCGGLGLNFPWANRCISLDLWWNHAVEQQAFGRIFRIGQKKETYMTRIVVKNSVDMRLLTMQLHKIKHLEKAISDGEIKQRPNLSLKQLANLFGFLQTNEEGHIQSVEADYDDEIEGGEGSGNAGLFGSDDEMMDGDGVGENGEGSSAATEDNSSWDQVGVAGHGRPRQTTSDLPNGHDGAESVTSDNSGEHMDLDHD